MPARMKLELLQLGRALFRLPAAARALARTPLAVPATHPAVHPRLPIALTLLALLAALPLLLPGQALAQTAPTFSEGDTSITVAEGTTTSTVLDTYKASDTDGDDLTWTLEGVDSGDFDLTENSDSSGYELTFSAAPDFESPADSDTDNEFEVTVKVEDDETPTANSATREVTITVTNVDEAGTVAIAGTLEGGVELTASVTDPDGSVTGESWQWAMAEMSSGPFTDIDSATNAKYTSVAADVGMFLRATATYKDAESTTTDKSAEFITSSAIVASNSKPTFDDGGTTTREVPENNSTGTNVGAAVAASDTDTSPADTLTYGLKNTGDHSSFTIVSTSGQIQTKSGETYDFEASKNSYTVTVTVHDGKDAANVNSTDVDAEITVTIDLTDANDAPTITTTDIAESIDENAATSVVIQTYAASDEDTPGTPQTLSWLVEGTDSGVFDINSSSGALTFKNVPNFESPADAGMNNVYNVTVKVTDSGTPVKSDTLAVTITVNNVNEAPTITSTGTGFTAPSFVENGTGVVATYMATDVDAMTTLSWSVEGTDSEDFDINSSNGMLTFKNAPNYEMPDDANADNDYDITVKVKDNGIPGNRMASNQLDATLMVTVTVDDVNEAPTITTSVTTADVDENTIAVLSLAASDVDNNSESNDSNNTLTWLVESAEDGGKFTIDSNSGALTFSNAPDFETPIDVGDTAMNNTYVVTVKVTDNGIHGNRISSNQLSDTHVLTVTVTNVNEAPTITTTETTHSAPSKMEIEYDDTSPDLNVVTYDASDPDTQMGNTLTWSVEGDDAGDFDIDPGTGALTFKVPPNYEIPVDSDTGNNYSITVKVTDNGIPTDRGMATWLEATQAVVVTVTDVNERPEFTGTPLMAEDWNENVENDGRGVLRVDDYDARDEEGGVTWTLTGNDMDKFGIDSNGVVTLNAVPDYETLAVLTETDGRHPLAITVVATDTMSGSTRRSAEVDVTITIVDLEEAGSIAVVHTRNGQDVTDLTDLQVDDVLEFTLSDPDTIPTPLTDAAIDWVIERRNPGDMNWVALFGQDVTSLTKEYTVDEDDTGKEIRATVTYTDRLGAGKTAESDDTDAAEDERDVAPPRFREGASQMIREGEAGRDTETVITATDRDGEVLVFGILQGTHSDLFELIPSPETTMVTYSDIEYPEYTAQLRAIEALDYEALSNKTFTLTLTLSDGKAESNGRLVYDHEIDVTYDVTVTVTNVEEPGEITFSPDEVPEPGVQIEATLTDPDGSIANQSRQWQRSEDPEADPPVWDNIPGATSSTYTPSDTADVISGGDNEGEGYYLRARVTYSDGQGSGKEATAIAGQVGTANTRPQFPFTEDGQRSVPENTRAGTNIGDPIAADDLEGNSLTYTLTGEDAESFTIVSSTGQLRTKEPLDFEDGPTLYIFNIDVHDRRDSSGASSTHIDDTQLVIIDVDNVDEPGTVKLTTDTNRVQVDVEIRAELSDPDSPNGASGVTWQWARSTNRSTWTETPIATGATYTPTETDEGDTDEEDQGNYLRATATYTDGEGSGKTAEAVTSRVAGPPPMNASPVFPDSEDGQRELREDAGSGMAVEGPHPSHRLQQRRPHLHLDRLRLLIL